MIKSYTLISLFLCCILADYVQLNNVTYNNSAQTLTPKYYSISTNSCPIGQVCDYAYLSSLQMISILKQCNSDIKSLLLNLTSDSSLNESDIDNKIMTYSNECYGKLSFILTQLSSTYKQGANPSAGNA